jgi:hypothetical protein
MVVYAPFPGCDTPRPLDGFGSGLLVHLDASE